MHLGNSGLEQVISVWSFPATFIYKHLKISGFFGRIYDYVLKEKHRGMKGLPRVAK